MSAGLPKGRPFAVSECPGVRLLAPLAPTASRPLAIWVRGSETGRFALTAEGLTGAILKSLFLRPFRDLALTQIPGRDPCCPGAKAGVSERSRRCQEGIAGPAE